jgi:hypothetical protein
MRVRKDKYYLSEIIREFRDEKAGNLDTLLGVLQEGKLIACIVFPPYDERNVEIPAEVWKEFSLDEFGVPKRHRTDDEPREFTIEPDFAIKREKIKLSSVALAAVRSSANGLDEDYRRLLEAEGFLKAGSANAMQVSDWEKIVQRFAQWRDKLAVAEHKRDSARPVYVSHERWEEFCATSGIGYEAVPVKRKSGAPRKPHWEAIWEEAFVRLLRDGHYKVRSAFARQLHDWARGHIQGDPRTVPQANTIDGKLRVLERKAGIKS